MEVNGVSTRSAVPVPIGSFRLSLGKISADFSNNAETSVTIYHLGETRMVWAQVSSTDVNLLCMDAVCEEYYVIYN
jgi:hypothetical protein